MSRKKAKAALPPALQARYREAVSLHQAGQPARASALYAEVLKVRPRHFDSLHLRGVAALQLGDTERGIGWLEAAIKVDGSVAPAHFNLGNARLGVGQLEAAIGCFDRALALKPDYAQAWINRGNALLDLRRLPQALDSYDRALACKADYVDAWYNRGNALLDLGRPADALASYDRALALDAGHSQAWCNRGKALADRQALSAAAESYARALALRPGYPFLFGTWLHTCMKVCDWAAYTESAARLQQGIVAGGAVSPPFPVLAVLDSPALQQQAAACYAQARYPRSAALGEFSAPAPDGRIRVGYYSADFREHATTHLLLETLESHDAARFECYGFGFGPVATDAMSERITGAFHRFIDVNDMTDLQVAALSREWGIDIAVDLKGYTRDSRPGLFAAGCAPVQVNYLGYPGTMASGYHDYILADATVIPPAHRAWYTEQVVYLPGCYQANDSRRALVADTADRMAQGLPQHGFVFCCFNNNYKILPTTFACWMRILQAVEGSVLWLLEDNSAASAQLREAAHGHGVDPERLVFAPRTDPAAHLARHGAADLFLDTWPCNAHTTASDALWAGLPLLTLQGESFAGRVAASLLRALQLPELIATTVEDYEQCAIAMAGNPAGLARLRERLISQKGQSALFDGRAMARNLEAAYGAMYERHRAGLAPTPLAVDAQGHCEPVAGGADANA